MSDKQKTLSPFMERFLITILGTTLSIALTFGTTALVNSHKKKAAQKQTAMLVIHDINNTIESMEATKNQCEKYYESAQYFLEYMDCPEAAEPDRLAEAIDASLQLLTHSERENSINESTEKIFTGSLDAWNNLDNMRFVENVQYFYYTRRDWINMTNTSLSWRAPIEQAEIEELLEGCTWEWGTFGQSVGYYVTSKSNGNSIFLPAAGNITGRGNRYIGTTGSYWASTLLTHYLFFSEEDKRFAEILYFAEDFTKTSITERCNGLTVRPVADYR